jgi:hypothetical protein
VNEDMREEKVDFGTFGRKVKDLRVFMVSIQTILEWKSFST